LRLRREKELIVVEFAPIRKNPFKAQTRIHMLRDVSGKFKDPKYRWQLTANEDYWVDEDVADQFIVKGYAQGQLSRTYSEDEVTNIRSNVQNISLDQEVLQSG
jgi:hypothetical protein